MLDYLLNLGVRYCFNISTSLIGGWLVLKKDVKVNYTRKINHFTLSFAPLFIFYFFPYETPTPLINLLSLCLGLLYLGIYIKPIRERVGFIRLMFASFDRPEDHPYTFKWLWTQILCIYVIMVPMTIHFNLINRYELIFIPVLISGLGDGLAEPIGVRFGKHKYKTYALFCKEKHVRSLEGSACVLAVSILAVSLMYNAFTLQQFIIALITIPIIMTLAEAFSPHTWDNPFLFLIGGIMLCVILCF